METRALHLLDCFRETENKGAERTGQLPEEEPAGGKLVNKWKTEGRTVSSGKRMITRKQKEKVRTEGQKHRC